MCGVEDGYRSGTAGRMQRRWVVREKEERPGAIVSGPLSLSPSGRSVEILRKLPARLFPAYGKVAVSQKLSGRTWLRFPIFDRSTRHSESHE